MTDTERIFQANLEALTHKEIIIIEAKGQKDNPKSCTTQKAIKVELADGSIKVKYYQVTGMENPCKDGDKNDTCSSYACYSQD